MKKRFLTIASLLLAVSVSAQQDTATPAPRVQLSGYVEAFYAYDFAHQRTLARQSFLYSYNRHNSLSVNLAFARASYADGRVRANVALMAGTYANDNLNLEPGVFKNIFEANAGFRLSRRKNLWLDAGVLPSHIGWETVIGKDCPTLTRSLAAEGTPYFETGARLSYTSDNSKWMLALFYLIGWQRIERPAGGSVPSFGTQVTYRPTAKLLLNSSSFAGGNLPDSARKMRYFHDFFAQWQPAEKLFLTLGFDIGAEQKTPGSRDYHIWYTPTVITRYMFTTDWAVALRGEYYHDPGGVIFVSGTPGGFRTWGYSLGLDRAVNSHCMWRIEGRGFRGAEAFFSDRGTPVQNNFSLVGSLAVWF